MTEQEPKSRELDWSNAPIHRAIKADWKTPELLIEGSLNCGKTTVGLDKEIDALFRWPGIPILLFRWTEDAVGTKLKPAFDELLAIRGIVAEWNKAEKCYLFANGSRAYMFGLKAVSQIEMFNKIRGLGVCRIMGDQCEEMERAVAGELRGRLRPNLTATVTARTFPFQLTFIANTEDHDFWLSREFPLDNRIQGRKVYSLSVYDNPYLPQASIDSLVRQFPEDHPKYQTMILGRRGANIVGDPVFEGLYKKELHHRPIAINPAVALYESFEVGKHNPTWVVCQPIPGGGLSVLAGIRGEGLLLDDFMHVVQPYRAAWCHAVPVIYACVAPMGESLVNDRARRTPLDVVKSHGIHAIARADGNAPDVRLGMIEEIATLLRQRTPSGEEAFGVNNDETKFLIVTKKDGTRQSAFVHHAMEAGFVWDAHFVSVSNKELRQAREDDKFANAMHCIENIHLNFFSGRKPNADAEAQEKARIAALLAPSPRNRNVPFGQGHLG